MDYQSALLHHGIKGMHWGIRRYQNSDGTLTPEGVEHVKKKVEKLKKQQTRYERHEYRAHRLGRRSEIIGFVAGSKMAYSRALKYKRRSTFYKIKASRGRRKLCKYEDLLNRTTMAELTRLRENSSSELEIKHGDEEMAMDVINSMNDAQKEAFYVLVDDLIKDDEIDNEPLPEEDEYDE